MRFFVLFNLIFSAFIFLSNHALFSIENNASKLEKSSYSIEEILATVSENYVLQINEALSELVNEKEINAIKFNPLLGGGTQSKVFHFDVGNKKYVLRLLDKNQPIERRKSELSAHKIGAELQISPKIIYVDQKFTVMVMEFIEGKTLTRDDLNNPEIVKEVMEALKKFHHYADQEQLIKRTKVGATEDLYNRYKNKKGIVFPSCFDQLHRKLQDDFIGLNRKYMPSHGDFNPRNILVTKQGHVYIIDWAQAGIDHPFLDIGWLSTFLAANNEQVKNLLKEYLEKEPTELELKEALFFKDVTTFLLATLWLGRQEERDQSKLDAILKSSLKKGSEYILNGVSVDDVLQKKGMELTVYSLGWLKEFMDNQSSSCNCIIDSSSL